LPIDNNPVENSIRPIAVGKKNWLFAGSEPAGAPSKIFQAAIALMCGARAGCAPYQESYRISGCSQMHHQFPGAGDPAGTAQGGMIGKLHIGHLCYFPTQRKSGTDDHFARIGTHCWTLCRVERQVTDA
jgi:hypothetical protein